MKLSLPLNRWWYRSWENGSHNGSARPLSARCLNNQRPSAECPCPRRRWSGQHEFVSVLDKADFLGWMLLLKGQDWWDVSPQGPPGAGPGMPSGSQGHGRGQGSWGGEMAFSVPAHKCGLVIGRGGENVKSINQQTGAFVKMTHQPPPNGDPNFKLFTIRGSPQQIDHAKQLIEEKIEVHSSEFFRQLSGKGMQRHLTDFILFWPGTSVSSRRWSWSRWANGSL